MAVGVFQTDEAGYGAWTALGAVSIISHGAFLVFTFPLWLVVGIAATGHESSRGEIDGRNANAETFRPYSRFPPGLPPGVDEAVLRGHKAPASPPAPTPPPPVTPPPVDGAAPLDRATPGV